MPLFLLYDMVWFKFGMAKFLLYDLIFMGFFLRHGIDYMVRK